MQVDFNFVLLQPPIVEHLYIYVNLLILSFLEQICNITYSYKENFHLLNNPPLIEISISYCSPCLLPLCPMMLSRYV